MLFSPKLFIAKSLHSAWFRHLFSYKICFLRVKNLEAVKI